MELQAAAGSRSPCCAGRGIGRAKSGKRLAPAPTGADVDGHVITVALLIGEHRPRARGKVAHPRSAALAAAGGSCSLVLPLLVRRAVCKLVPLFSRIIGLSQQWAPEFRGLSVSFLLIGAHAGGAIELSLRAWCPTCVTGTSVVLLRLPGREPFLSGTAGERCDQPGGRAKSKPTASRAWRCRVFYVVLNENLRDGESTYCCVRVCGRSIDSYSGARRVKLSVIFWVTTPLTFT